ncbi:hypothetical protein FIU87_12790 [Bacillus sp. THAF10]|nr:hypothetical protein FIU87_12790 [Bacillus sp. THAF10]
MCRAGMLHDPKKRSREKKRSSRDAARPKKAWSKEKEVEQGCCTTQKSVVERKRGRAEVLHDPKKRSREKKRSSRETARPKKAWSREKEVEQGCCLTQKSVVARRRGRAEVLHDLKGAKAPFKSPLQTTQKARKGKQDVFPHVLFIFKHFKAISFSFSKGQQAVFLLFFQAPHEHSHDYHRSWSR